MRYLCAKAKHYQDLGHFERRILLHTVGKLGKEGEKYIYHFISHCSNYNYEYTQRQIDKKHPAPMSCRSIQKIMGNLLKQINCNCMFEKVPQKGYLSPLLHVYPNATKDQGRKIHKSMENLFR